MDEIDTVWRITLLKMKGTACRLCVISATLSGCQTWCFKENVLVVLKRTERGMMRSVCGVKLMDDKMTSELMTGGVE